MDSMMHDFHQNFAAAESSIFPGSRYSFSHSIHHRDTADPIPEPTHDGFTDYYQDAEEEGSRTF